MRWPCRPIRPVLAGDDRLLTPAHGVRLDRQAQADRLQYGQQGLERRIARRGERPVQRFAADAGLGCNSTESAPGFGYGPQGQQSSCPVAGGVERFHRGFHAGDRQFTIGA